MPNQFYIYEDLVALGQPTFTDDGSGSDWLVLSGDYGGTAASPGAFLILSNYEYNVSPPPGDFAFAFSLTTALPTVMVYGQIENAIGGAGAEVIFGGAWDNILQGDPNDVAGGEDVIHGFGGQDIIFGMGGADNLTGGDGNDLIYGDVDPFSPGGNVAQGSDWLWGDAGNDTLIGGWGNNLIYGGANTDTVDYSGFFDDFGDFSFRIEVNLTGGTVHVYQADLINITETLVVTDTIGQIETLVGTNGNDLFLDDATPDPNDTLIRTFQGGAGNDSYYLLSGVLVTEAAGGGYDHVYGYVGTMPDNVEALTMYYLSFLAPDSRGNDLDNIIEGNLLDNEISGGGGNDRIVSLGGRDMIWGEFGNDTVLGGFDSDTIQGNEGNDSLLGEASRDWLYGNEGRDSLFGGDGGDFMLGQEAADRLFGGSGNDSLSGNQGADTLTGGSGADSFVYSTLLDALPPTATRATERITDFTPGQDKIDLRNLSPGLDFIGGQRFHDVAGEVRYNAATGVLMGDTDGNGRADFAITLTGAPALTAGDLILIL